MLSPTNFRNMASLISSKLYQRTRFNLAPISIGMLIVISLVLCDNSNSNNSNSNSNINNNTDQKVQVGVYYESLCPDSRRFFLRQLMPVYKEIGAIIEPVLVPFGHARIVGPNMMICQHGPRECEGNRLAACVQSKSSNKGDVINTISCLFERRIAPKDCIVKNLPNVPYEDIEKCKTSNDSFIMMESNELLTGKTDYIPKLTLNGQYSEDIQNELENDLKSTICKNYNGTKPQACSM